MSHNAKVDTTRCQACGKRWGEHLGMQGLCAENQELKASIERKDVLIRGLRLRIKDFDEERVNRAKRRLIANGYK